MFRAFDFASPDTHSPQRFATTVPQQALFMMNSPFVIEQAKALAAETENIKVTRRRSKRSTEASRTSADANEIALGEAFIKRTSEESSERRPRDVADWQYGYGTINEKIERVKVHRAAAFLRHGLAGWGELARFKTRLMCS